VLADRRVALMCVIYFTIVMGQYGLTFWMPALIQAAGVSGTLEIGMFTAVPYGAGAIAMIFFGRSADRRRERRWHAAGAMLIGAVGMTLSAIAGTHTAVAIGFLTIASTGVFSCAPLFWSLPTAFPSGAAAAAGIAAINSIGNLAGFVSPYVVGWLKDLTHSTQAGMFAVSGVLVAGAVIILVFVPARLVNR
jgi:nitrate/nitrite transporter NarK